jgi:hypothetical protein
MLPQDMKDGPSPCSNIDLVAKIACSGPLGNALQLALRNLTTLREEQAAEENSTHDDTTTNGKDIPKQDEVKIDEDFAECVVKSFGQAVASTRWKNEEYPQFLAPPALLRGRLEHYNRVGGNWRITVRDAEISPHIPLDRNRKRRDQQSLWQAGLGNNDAKRRRYGRNIDLRQAPVQILAYDDL